MDEFTNGGAPGISADRLNEPFHLKNMVYDSANNKIDLTFGRGRALFLDTVVEKTADSTYSIPTPAINTTYYIYLKNDGTFTSNTTGVSPSNSIKLWSVSTGTSLSTLTKLDLRAQVVMANIKPNDIGAVNKAGDTMTGALYLPFVEIGNNSNGAIELGKKDGTTSTPFIDFHSGATVVDYDARIIGTGGNGVNGGGNIDIKAANVTVNAKNVWHAGNDGAGSGLDADMVDGYHASSFAKFAAGTYTGDGTTGRAINVGFAPLYVVVQTGTVGTNYRDIRATFSSQVTIERYRQQSDGQTYTGKGGNNLTATGFTIPNIDVTNGMNTSAVIYDYIAWG